VTVFKLNDAEVPVIGAALDLPAEDPVAFARAAAGRYGIPTVCVTQGAQGATAWDGNGEARVEGLPVDVVDTVGAGDAFTAGFTGSLLRGAGLADALRAGNALGALVASRAGAVPAWTTPELDDVLSPGRGRHHRPSRSVRRGCPPSAGPGRGRT
jgi:fructokinase